MKILDRLSYALVGILFGTFIGLAGWWLYGMAYSLNYDGPGMDPALRHWLTWACGAFGIIGFLFRERVGDVIGETLSAILHFESGEGRSPNPVGAIFFLVFMAIVIAAIWFTAPTS